VTKHVASVGLLFLATTQSLTVPGSAQPAQPSAAGAGPTDGEPGQGADTPSDAPPSDAPSTGAPPSDAPPDDAVSDEDKPTESASTDADSRQPATPGPVPSEAPAEPASIAEASDFDELEAAVDAESAETTTRAASPASAPAPGVAIASIQPDISAILDVAAAYFSDDEPLQDGAHDPKKNGFNWQQLEISLLAPVDPYLRFDSHLVFSPFGVEVEEAYATTLALPLGLQARFGQFLTRFGRANATHPHTWDFADQPFELSRLFGGEGERGLGIELSLLLPLPWSVELVGSATDAAGEATARSFFGAQDLGVESPADLLYTTAVKQFFALSDSWSLAAGLSANFGPNSTGRDNRTAIYGADFYLKYRPIHEPEPTVVSLHSEWFYRRRQIPEELLQDYGQFTQMMWRFALRWAAALRYEFGSPSYDIDGNVTDDPLDPEWNQVRQRGSASLSFYPTEFSRFRLQGNYDVPGYRDPIWATFLTAEVVIGAHGAHAF